MIKQPISAPFAIELFSRLLRYTAIRSSDSTSPPFLSTTMEALKNVFEQKKNEVILLYLSLSIRYPHRVA